MVVITMDRERNKHKEEMEKYLTTTSKQTGFVFTGKYFGYMLGFLVNLVLAKYFGPKVLGQYSLVKTVISMVIIFSVFGLNNGLVKYISRYRATDQNINLNQTIKIAVAYAGLFSVIGAIVVFFMRGIIAHKLFNEKELMKVFSYGAWLIIPLTFKRIFKGIFRGFKQLKYYIFSIEVIRRILFLLLLLLLIFINLQHSLYVIISLLIVESLIIFSLYKRTNKLGINLKEILFASVGKNYSQIRNEVFSYSFTLLFINFMNVILDRIDKLMLGIYKSSELVGIYRVASLIIILITFLHSSARMIFSPIVSELYSKDQLNLLEDMYSAITKWVIIFTFPIVINIILFPEVILNFFGPEYLIGVNTLIVLAVGYFVRIGVGTCGIILSMSDNEKLVLINNFLLAIMNIILNIILIPRYGIFGAGLATAISFICVNIIKVFMVKYLLGIFPYKKNYLYLLINLIVVGSISYGVRIVYNNLIALILVTAISIFMSIGISIILGDEYDKLMFAKFKNKIKSLI